MKGYISILPNDNTKKEGEIIGRDTVLATPIDVFMDGYIIDNDSNTYNYAEVVCLDEPDMDYFRDMDSYTAFMSDKLKVKKSFSLYDLANYAVNSEIRKKINRKDGFIRVYSSCKRIALTDDYTRTVIRGNSNCYSSSGQGCFVISCGVGDSISLGCNTSVAVLRDRCSFVNVGGYNNDIIDIGENNYISSSGVFVRIVSFGNDSSIASSGKFNDIVSNGNNCVITSSGEGTSIASNGKDCSVSCLGKDGVARAKIGSLITLAKWERVDDKDTPINVVTKKVDGVEIKEDTFYKLVDGKFVESKRTIY